MNRVESALAWHDAGFCVIYPAEDGTKAPLDGRQWQHFMSERPTREQVEQWASTRQGIGLVMGAVSDQAVMFELEKAAVDAELHLQLRDWLQESAPGLWEKLNSYVEMSGSGGLHWLFRVDTHSPVRTTRLARRPSDTPGKVDVLIETKAEGGFTICAPSGGTIHPKGGQWITITGTPGVVPVLSPEELDALYAAARTFDQMPETVSADHRDARQVIDGDLTPGQDYSQRHTWADILVPLRWTFHHAEGEKDVWTRPGKPRRDGGSATVNYDGNDNIWIFSSSVSGYPIDESITKFRFYAWTHHGGDDKAAARELRRLGYGSKRDTSSAQAESRAMLSLLQGGQSAPTTSGSLALAPREESSSPASPLKQTELGNARRFAEVESPRMRYVPQRRSWVAWRGERWEWQVSEAGTCPLAVQAMVELIEAMSPADEHELKWMVRSASEKSIKAAIRLAAADPRVVMSLDNFDARPEELNTPTGVVDLRDASVRPPSPDDLHTRLTGVGVDFDADCPRWLRFLADTFGGDEEMIEFLQRLAGYAATGEVTHHVLPFLFGNGANGKSVFLDVLQQILGEYAAPAQSELLLAGRDTHESFIAMMSGLRLIVANEVGPTARFNEQRVKQFTGGDLITSRKLNQEPFTFKPTHTLVMAGNHKPRVDSGGESIWRRLRLIGFHRTVPKEQRIVGLADQLIEEEGPAILAWIVRGAMKQYVDGLKEPQSVLDETREYAEDEDHLGRFLEERVKFGGGSSVLIVKSDLYDAYKSWCHEEGEMESLLPGNTFGRELKARGVGEKKSNSRRFYTNVTLLASEREQVERDVPRQLIYGD